MKKLEDLLPSETTKTIQELLSELTDREERVIRLRYGIDDGIPRTLEVIAKEFNLSPQSIHRIEAKAIKKLRHPARHK